MSLPTAADLKAFLNITNSVNDDELDDMLDQAVDVVEGIVGPLTPRAVTETHRDLYAPVLVLRSQPVAQLVSVSSGIGVFETPLVTGLFDLDAEAGLLQWVDGSWFSGSYTVKYSAGRLQVPPAVQGAILIIAGHLWESQRGVSPAALPLQDQSVYSTSDFPSAGFAVPNRARELLSQYAVTKVGIG